MGKKRKLTLLLQQQCHRLEDDALETDIFPCPLMQPPNQLHHDQLDYVPNMVLHLDPLLSYLQMEKNEIIKRLKLLFNYSNHRNV